MIEAESFRQGMRRLAAGVSLITTLDQEGRPHGLVATSVTSVSAEPPTLLVCVNRSASCHDPLEESGVFCVNFLSEEDDEVARRFSSSQFRDVRFARDEWAALTTGAPGLKGCLASLDCSVTTRLAADSHTIFIGKVREIRLWDRRVSPLIYVDGGFRRLEERVEEHA